MKKNYIISWVIILFFILSGNVDAQVQKLVASDRTEQDWFGTSVSLSGNYLIIGSPLDREDSLGQNPIGHAGSAYIFHKNDSVWTQEAKIIASNRCSYAAFGNSVDICGDYAIVGAYQDTPIEYTDSAGAAYIFKRQGTNWIQQQKIISEYRNALDTFGWSVAIDSNYAIVGAIREKEDSSESNWKCCAGAAYIFKREGEIWTQQAKLVASDREEGDYLGWSVAISGEYAVVGASPADDTRGAAYIFKRSGEIWNQQTKLTASDGAQSDWFGESVSIYNNFVIVGAPYEDEDISGNNYLSDAGAAYIYKRTGDTWNQQFKLVSSDRAEGDTFGYSVSIFDEYVVVGAYAEDDDVSGNNALSKAGSAYIFKFNGEDAWHQTAKIIAPVRAEKDYFGFNVSIDKNHVLVGASAEEEDTNELNTLENSGAAYVFNTTIQTAISNSPIKTFTLSQNYPNPLNPNTNIHYEVPEASDIKISVYDITGHLMEVLVNRYHLPGAYNINWNASKYSSGIYIYRLQYGDKSVSKKMILLK